MLKLSGCVIILAVGFMTGMLRSGKIKERAEITGFFIEFTKKLNEKIEFRCKPLNEILLELNSELTDKLGIMESIKSKGMTGAVEELKDKISNEAYSILLGLSRNIGSENYEKTLELCKYTYERLFSLYEKEKENLTERLRMNKILPILGAIGIVILII